MSLRRLISVLERRWSSRRAASSLRPAEEGRRQPVAPAQGAARRRRHAAAAPRLGRRIGAAPSQMTEDAPPADMNGTDENPDAPRGIERAERSPRSRRSSKQPPGYPIEEALRPITLPQNMSRGLDRAALRRSSPVRRRRRAARALRHHAPGPARPDLRARRHLRRPVDADRSSTRSTPARPSASTSPCCSRTGSASASACRSTSTRSRCRSRSARR